MPQGLGIPMAGKKNKKAEQKQHLHRGSQATPLAKLLEFGSMKVKQGHHRCRPEKQTPDGTRHHKVLEESRESIDTRELMILHTNISL